MSQLDDSSLSTEQLIETELKTIYDELNGDFGYILATGVESRVESAESVDDVPSIIKRIIAAKVAYEVFME